MHNDLIGLLNAIKEKPTLYLSKKSLESLNDFLHGWIARSPSNIIGDSIMNDFQFWIEKKFRNENTQSWVKIILFHSSNEFSAFDDFYLLFEEFQKKK